VPWRRWNNVLHRDIGYLVVGLTLIYAVSGIAVNHIDSWNPNYSIERETLRFEAFEPLDRETTIAGLLEELDLPTPIDAFRSTPAQIELLYDGWSVKADVSTGAATVIRPRERPVLFDLNFLHLNHAKKAWTWVADVYAGLLAVMAITGMFVLRGRKGITGRGKWWVTVGLLVPIGFLIFLRWLP
jgi:hypothetical protein